MFQKLFCMFMLVLAGCGWPLDGNASDLLDEYVAHKIAKSSVVIEINFFGWRSMGSGTLIHDPKLGYGISPLVGKTSGG